MQKFLTNPPGLSPRVQKILKMTRNKERQQELQPARMQYAISRIKALGYEVTQVDNATLQFIHNDSPILVYPYTGWFTGKSVSDGRGIHVLIGQLKKSKNK